MKTTKVPRTLLVGGVLAILALMQTGCGSRGAVSGTVRFKDKPLSGGRITFISQKTGGASVVAVIGDDGSYKITDCPAGPVKITVQTVFRGSGYAQPRKTGRLNLAIIPARYADPTASGIDYLVRASWQQHDIDLQP
jgi:hypothetical protein